MGDRKYYLGRKAAGACVRCGREKAENGKVLCAGCLEKARNSARERRSFLKEIGLCLRCGRKAEPGHVYCRAHLIKRRMESRERGGSWIPRGERTSHGMCYICGGAIAPGERLCGRCKERATANLPDKSGNEAWRRDNAMVFKGGGMA